MPHGLALSASVLAKIRKMGIGILRSGTGNVYYETEPADASIVVSLPALSSLGGDVKTVLGAAYDHFDASRWREGFEDACKAFERSAKKYLKKWVKTGRVRFVVNGRPVSYTNKQIDRLTMGGLEKAFEKIQAQTSSDRLILHALKTIREDRNKLTHDKWSLRTENRLRANVSHHMWIISQAMLETFK